MKKASKTPKEVRGGENDPFIKVAKMYVARHATYFDRSKTWWLWDEEALRWKPVDQTDVLNQFREDVELKLFSTVMHKHYLIEALEQQARMLEPKTPPSSWIQFHNEFVDIITGQRYEVNDDWFATNPIPWSIGNSTDTPVMDELFHQWVEPELVPTLYEILAYCCLSQYPLHTIFCFIGGGANGKSKFQDLMRRFIGEENVISTELDILVTNQFESSKLYKKLVAVMGETNFSTISKTNKIKELTGEDKTRFEQKHKPSFDGFNYAKLMINTNSLPMSEDETDGFARRWCIIDFPNQFKEGANPVDRVPKQEYRNLARKVVEILPSLLRRGIFTGQGDYQERRRRYVEASNPFPLWLDEYCVRDPDGVIEYSTLYTHYNGYLKSKNRRLLTRSQFSKVLTGEMLEFRRTTVNINGQELKGFLVFGIRLKQGVMDYAD